MSTVFAALTDDTDLLPPVRSEIVFIDPGVDDVPVLLAGLRPEVEAVLLDAAEPAPLQMARALAGRQGLAAVHVIAHGAPGAVAFSGGVLTTAELAAHSGELAAIGRRLRSGGTLALWSCDTGAGAQGAAFVAALSGAAGAAVAAADSRVGAAAKGGSWYLPVTARAPLTAAGLATYEGVMAITNFAVNGSTDGFINASEVTSSNITISVTRNSNQTVNWGSQALILVKDANGVLLYWQIIDLNNRDTPYPASIPVGLLPQGQALTFSVVQGTGIVGSGTGSTYPTFAVHGGGTNVSSGTGSDWLPAITSTVDTVAPTASFANVTLDLVAASDSGVSNSDNITTATLPTITVSSLAGMAMSVNDVIQIIDTSSGNAVVGSYTVQSSDLTGGLWNGTTKDITLTTALSAGLHNLAVQLGDAAGNTPAAASTSLLAVTIDATAPTLSSSLPADITGTTGGTAPLNRNIVLSFSENVFAGGGSIVLTRDNGGGPTTIQTFTLTAGQTSGTGWTISGSTVVLNPTNDLVSTGT